jgi:hypothetical protein
MCWRHEKYSINEIYFYLLLIPHTDICRVQTFILKHPCVTLQKKCSIFPVNPQKTKRKLIFNNFYCSLIQEQLFKLPDTFLIISKTVKGHFTPSYMHTVSIIFLYIPTPTSESSQKAIYLVINLSIPLFMLLIFLSHSSCIVYNKMYSHLCDKYSYFHISTVANAGKMFYKWVMKHRPKSHASVSIIAHSDHIHIHFIVMKQKKN